MILPDMRLMTVDEFEDVLPGFSISIEKLFPRKRGG